MIFNSFIFLFVFLPITYLVFWSLRSTSSRYVWLAVTGYVFYGWWDWRFCFLMAFSTLVSYTAGLAFLKFTSQRGRLLCLVIPITIDLLLLGFFKYANFLIQTFDDIHKWMGYEPFDERLNVILPVGISFYTFHTITYIVDCYRGAIKPTRNLFEFAAYVSLFSQLVAGPIVRFRQIEDDLENLGSADRTRWLNLGISFFVYGLVEKVLLADTIAELINPGFKDYGSLSTAGAWLIMLGYSFQLYFDFCGYSDMAVGLGYMFGLRIPQNFNSPYKALNPSDFWGRWHISLSSCLRDYLYIPLGGNRQGELCTYRNLMITMLLGGLWHGANWTFIIWGFYHGMLLGVYRRFASSWDRLPAIFRQGAMFLLVLVGWVFFRADNIHMAGSLLATMFVPVGGAVAARWDVLVVLLFIAGVWSMRGPNANDLYTEECQWSWPKAYFRMACFASCLVLILGTRNSPFLYFQF